MWAPSGGAFWVWHNRAMQDATTRYTDGSYLASNPDWHDSHAPWKAREIVRVLHDAGAKPKSICDVGCGTGGVMRAMAPQLPGVEMTGYEVSPQAAAMVDPGVDVVLGDFRDDSRTFDLVMAIDVFEHVPDYHGFLHDLHQKAPQGMFHIPLDLSLYTILRDKRTLITHREKLGHIHNFSRETALATLRDTGWQPAHMNFTRGIFMHDKLDTTVRKLKWLPVRALMHFNEAAAAKVAAGFGLMVLAETTSGYRVA